MFDDFGSGSRDEGGSRQRSRPRSDRDYYRSRQEHSRSPARSPRQYPQDEDLDGRDGRDNRGTYDSEQYRDHSHYPGDELSGGGGRYNEGIDTLQYDDGPDQNQGYYEDYEDRGRRRKPSFCSRTPPPSPRSPTPAIRGRPYHTLILEGLPPDVTEDGVLDGFDAATKSPTFASEQIRAVRLRTNKMGRRICFVEFHRVEDAEDFVKRHHYTMTFDLTGAGGMELEPVRVNLNYSRAREEGERAESRGDRTWRCHGCPGVNFPHRLTCYRCGREKDDDSVASGPVLTGETDEAPQQLPSQYLVVRDLEPSVTEEVLAKGIKKLFVDEVQQPTREEGPPAKKLKSTAPVGKPASLGAREGSLRRVFLMRDRRTNDSWKYGFAEFWTLEDAQAAAAKFRALPKFTIASRQVSIGFIHTGVFVPVMEPHYRETSPPTAFVPVYNREVLLKYWDNRVYPSIHDVNLKPPNGLPDPEDGEVVDKQPNPEKTNNTSSGGQDPNKRAKKAKDLRDKAIVMAPQMQMWAKKRAELHRAGQGRADSTGTGVDDGGSGAGVGSASGERRAFGPRAAHWRDRLTSYSSQDGLACLLCMRKFETAQDLRDHEVLSLEHDANLQDEAKQKKATTRLARLGGKPQTVVRRTPRDRSERPPVYTSYADPDGLQCLACQRKFRSVGALRLHERESEMHKRSMSEAGKVERAVAELLKLGKVPIKLRPVKGTRSRYRDRAKERRQAFGQPTKPKATFNGGSVAQSSTAKPTTTAASTTTAAPALPAKGAALLSKMGWTAGQGLGADGSGRAEAIQTDFYMPGVGLGAEGGKVGDAAAEASRKTNFKYSSFVQQTKDKARERFERLS